MTSSVSLAVMFLGEMSTTGAYLTWTVTLALSGSSL